MLADVQAQLLAGQIPRGRSSALLNQQARVEEAAKIAARGRIGDVGLEGVGGPVGLPEEALLERDDETIRPAALLDELFQEGPACAGVGELAQPPVRLCDVRLHADLTKGIASRSGW